MGFRFGDWLRPTLIGFLGFACTSSGAAIRPGGDLEIANGLLLDRASGKVVAVTNTYEAVTYWGEDRFIAQAPGGNEWRLFTNAGDYRGAVPFAEVPRDAVWRWEGSELRVTVDGMERAIAEASFARTRQFAHAAGNEPVDAIFQFWSAAGWIRFGNSAWEVLSWPDLEVLARFTHGEQLPQQGAHAVARLASDGRIHINLNQALWAIDPLTGIGECLGFIPFGGLSRQLPDGRIFALSLSHLVLHGTDGSVLDSLHRGEFGIAFNEWANLGHGGAAFPLSPNDEQLAIASHENELMVVAADQVRAPMPASANPFLFDWWVTNEFDEDANRWRTRFYHFQSAEPVIDRATSGNPFVVGPTTTAIRKGNWDVVVLRDHLIELNRADPAASRATAIPDPLPTGEFQSVELLRAQPATQNGFLGIGTFPVDPISGLTFRRALQFNADLKAFETAQSEDGIPVANGMGFWSPFGYIPHHGGQWFELPAIGAAYISEPVVTGTWIYSPAARWLYLDTRRGGWLYSPMRQAWIFPAFANAANLAAYYDPIWHDWDAFDDAGSPAFFSRRQWTIFINGSPIERWSLEWDGIANIHFFNDPAPLFNSVHYNMRRSGPDSAVLDFHIELGELRVEGTYLFSFETRETGTVSSTVNAIVNGAIVETESDSGRFQLTPWRPDFP